MLRMSQNHLKTITPACLCNNGEFTQRQSGSFSASWVPRNSTNSLEMTTSWKTEMTRNFHPGSVAGRCEARKQPAMGFWVTL